MEASQQPFKRRNSLRQAGLLWLLGWLTIASALGQRAPRHRAHEPTPAAAPALVPPVTDTLQQAVTLPPATLDSLAAELQTVPAVDSARLLWLQTPPTLADLVGDRLGCVETDAPHRFTPAVLAFVRLFTERQRSYTQRLLEREQFYFPMFEKYLTQYNLPTDLKYLSVVESSLLPAARSRTGALGLWQFMPGTAGDLRLRRDEWVDERIHPEKATEAACKHLRYLYGVFHDWELALAAYNWGAGSMQRVMRRTGKRTFWDLYPYLPTETRNYVPTFTAVLYAMKYAQQHQLHDPALRYQHFEPLDTLGLHGQAFDLSRLSRALGYDDSLTLGRFNPEVRRGTLPDGYRPYVLRYPSTARARAQQVDRATLLAYCRPLAELPVALAARPVRLLGGLPGGATDATAGVVATTATAPARRRRLYYLVRRGQSLTDVAEKFDVSAARLRRWNELPQHLNKLRPGRELLVLLPAQGTGSASAAPALANAAAPAAPVMAAAPLLAVAAVARAMPDSAARAVATANARYAQQAQERAARETARLRELTMLQRQAQSQTQAAALAARRTAREQTQRQMTARVAALAQAKAEAAARARLADAEAADEIAETTEPTEAVAASPDRKIAATTGPAIAAARSVSAVKAVAVSPTRPADETRPTRTVVATTPVSTPAEESATYTTQVGDNPTRIAREHSLSLAELRAFNPGLGEQVRRGQVLRLRAGASESARAVVATTTTKLLRLETHTVQPGDTLFNISRRFGVTVERLRQLNHLTSDDVKLGQRLVVPTS